MHKSNSEKQAALSDKESDTDFTLAKSSQQLLSTEPGVLHCSVCLTTLKKPSVFPYVSYLKKWPEGTIKATKGF